MYEDLKTRLRALVIMDEVGSNNPLGRDAADAIDRLEREAQALARDWCVFCEDIGMTVDTHQAIADRINAELTDKAVAWDANAASIKSATEAERERCARIAETADRPGRNTGSLIAAAIRSGERAE